MSDRDERDCPRDEEAVAWALHALEPDEEMRFLEHLPECASCQATVRDAEEVLTGLGASVEQVDPPPTMRDSLLARAAETPQEHQPPPPPDAVQDAPPAPAPVAAPQRSTPRHRSGPSWLSRRGRRLAVAAAALVAVVAIGGLAVRNVQLQQQRDAEAQNLSGLIEELARPGTRLALLDTDDGNTVAAVLVTDGQRQVYAVGMPPNAADETTYVLWGIPEGAAPQPLGTFDVAGSESGPQAVGSAGEADRFAAYAISLEPGRTAPASPSAVMAKGQVAI